MKQRNLRALEAFEAVSRLQSLTAAAEELGVTQSAISHQMRHLTEELGEKLLRWVGRRIELTAAGARLAASLRAAFERIDRSLDEAIGGDHATVRLAVCSSFAPGWLIRRLGELYATHPDVNLQLRMYATDPELTDEVADAFVTTLPTVPGFHALRLKTELLVPVRAANAARVERSLPLITTTLPPKTLGGDWADYCKFAGISLSGIHAGFWLQATHYLLAFEMARRGLGIALVPDFLAEEALKAGEMEIEFDARMPTNEDYFFCVKLARRDEDALRKLEHWFRAQAGNGSDRGDPAVNGKYA